MKDKIIIGIDGGASKTSAVIFDSNGKTLAYESSLGTNLSVDEVKASNRVVSLINKVSEKAKVNLQDISAIGIGLAGASNKNGRDRLFGILDNLNLSDRSLITNDIDSVYDFIWSSGEGILVNVGTGVICVAKKNNKFIRVAGKGHENGDVGSGYWIGKEALIEIGLSYSDDNGVKDALLQFLNKLGSANYDSLISEVNNSEEKITTIASFAEDIILLAENGNEFSRNIVQRATRVVAEYIIEIRDIMEYGNKDIILAGNGSILRNDYFRKELQNALSFDFNEIKWVFLDMSPAYTSGLLAARLKKININKKLLNSNPIRI
tara:strand:- start:1226 stop:2188 length:963 start_codon:yes stop_codon:yes gene_type:complete